MRTQEADAPDEADSSLKERQEQTRNGFRAAIAEAQSAVLEVREGDKLDESKRAAMDALARCVDDLVSKVFDANEEGARQRLKAQANWFALKLETARVASETRLEHKAIEVNAACAAKFDQKLRDMCDGGGSVEDG